MKELEWSSLRDFLRRNIPLLAVIALGAALMLLPSSSSSDSRSLRGTGTVRFADEEERLAEVVSRIEGAGESCVLLRMGKDQEKGGAVVVCPGADSAAVRLNITRAVSAYTGLGSDRIIILKSKQGGT